MTTEPMTDSDRAYRAWVLTIDTSEDALMDRMAAQASIAAGLREANPALPVITSYIIAGDMQSAEAATGMLEHGVAFDHALLHVGSYGRIGWLLDRWDAGDITDADLFRHLPDEWPSADPDDTDPRFLAAWEAAWSANGRQTILDDPNQPLPPGRRLTVYRGQGRDERAGIAWSLSEDIARKFANGASVRVAGGVKDPVVYTARIHRRMVMAYLTARGEQEVIINPAFLR